MKYSDIQAGDTIRITKTFTVRALEYDDSLTVKDNDLLYNMSPERYDTVELVNRPVKTPVNWPPQTGDVWALPDGTEWYARKWRGGAKGTVVLQEFDAGPDADGYSDEANAGNSSYRKHQALDAFLKLNPECLRRRNR